MSVKYGNSCATYNIPLNISENNILRIGSAHLQHFIQVNVNIRTDDCKPMMLKMHLEIDDSPASIGGAEEQNIEHNNSINGLRQSVQQLEEEMRAVKDALLQQAKEDDVANRIDKTPDVDNNATQQVSNANKQANNENKLSGEHLELDDSSSNGEAEERNIVHNNTNDGLRQSIEQMLSGHTNSMPEFFDLRYNCVYIQNFECYNSSSEKAFHNIRKLANEMNVNIPDDAVIHIDVHRKLKNCLDYYVYFCDARIKEEFLKNSNFFAYNSKSSPLRILNHSYWGILSIGNIQSTDMSLSTAYDKVKRIAEKLGIEDGIHGHCIEHIDVFSPKRNILTYSVRFYMEYMREEYLRKEYLLKQFPETNSLRIWSEGRHKLLCSQNVSDFSTTVVSANVIGLAELIGLSLTTDDFKRIYVLDNILYFGNRGFFSIVEFSSRQVKDKFLKKKHKLEEMGYSKHLIEISDIHAKKNIVSIKYECHKATAISFIGLAKQLGFSLTPDQFKHFFDLSEFIDKACTKRVDMA